MSRLRPRLTFSNVISVIALFVALGGGAYAAVKLKPNQVKSKHIAPDAVQGVDANESSFGPVPRATQADNAASAATADSAATLDGFTAGDFQGGDGFDHAVAGFLDQNEVGGILVFEGGIGVECKSNPEIQYEDISGDQFETDLWVNGVHEEVADGDAASTLFPLAASDTGQVHIWGGAGTIAHVVVSVIWDGSATECRVAFTSQQNLNSAASAAAASARAKGDLSRGALPHGWVKPSPNP